jgi:hypothetical protein
LGWKRQYLWLTLNEISLSPAGKSFLNINKAEKESEQVKENQLFDVLKAKV